MQIDVHQTLYPFYTIRKMPHVTATVTEIAFHWRSYTFYSRFFSHPIKLRGLPQWRTQKIVMEGVSFSGIWWSFAFGVRSL